VRFRHRRCPRRIQGLPAKGFNLVCSIIGTIKEDSKDIEEKKYFVTTRQLKRK
jgi:hypothetical protein